MVKHTQTVRQLLPTNCLSVFDHFVLLALKGLRKRNEHIKTYFKYFVTLNYTSYFQEVRFCSFLI